MPTFVVMLGPTFLLEPTMVRLAFDALQRVASTTRAMLAGAVDVDPNLYHNATAELSKEDANIVHSVATLSTIDQSLKCRFEGIGSDTSLRPSRRLAGFP